MNINIEALNQIPQLLELIVSIKSTIENGVVEKRWLNTRELAEYTSHKFGTIQTKIKKGEFTQGVHYFKRGGMLLFDKTEVDNWVIGVKSANNLEYQGSESDEIMNDILSDLIA